MNALIELGELADALERNKRLEAQLTQAEADFKTLQANYDDQATEIEELNDKIEELEKNAIEADVLGAVDDLLDEVQRPVGSFNFTVPATPAANRAILKLHDAVGRNL